MSQIMQNLIHDDNNRNLAKRISVIDDYIAAVSGIFGEHIRQIVLYGSYARGDFTSDSDIDIMFLVDLPDGQIEKYMDAVSEIGFDYNVEYDLWFMPIVKNEEHFRYWREAYPFYSKVAEEGVILYSAA